MVLRVVFRFLASEFPFSSTGAVQPDVSTRRLLKLLKETLKIPVIGLVDSDPYGLKARCRAGGG